MLSMNASMLLHLLSTLTLCSIQRLSNRPKTGKYKATAVGKCLKTIPSPLGFEIKQCHCLNIANTSDMGELKIEEFKTFHQTFIKTKMARRRWLAVGLATI